MNTPEQAPNAPQEQLIQDVNAARLASQEAGLHRQDELGTATARTTTTEFINSARPIDEFNAPTLLVDTVKGNTPQDQGEVKSQSVFAKNDKRRWDSKGDHFVGTDYKVWADTYSKPGVSTRTEKVKVERTAQNGEEYRHTFKNPDTARKFGALIAKQVARRAQNKSEQKAA